MSSKLNIAVYREFKELLESNLKIVEDDIKRFEVIMTDDELGVLIGSLFKEMIKKLLTFYSSKVGEDCLIAVLKQVPKLNALLVEQQP